MPATRMMVCSRYHYSIISPQFLRSFPPLYFFTLLNIPIKLRLYHSFSFYLPHFPLLFWISVALSNTSFVLESTAPKPRIIYMEQLKSEDQMEMMMRMMMMDMDKFPVFSEAYNGNVAELPPAESSGASSGNEICAMPQYIDHIDPKMAVSFTSTSPVLQESSAPPFSFSNSTTISGAGAAFSRQSQKKNSMAEMREMMFRIAAMQPVHIDPESVKPPKRRNVKISKDPQSVAARHRRERISERIRILQRLVPGGTKMDTASMLDEAIHYVKFLKTQVQSLQERAAANPAPLSGIGLFPVAMCSGSYLPIMEKAFQSSPPQSVQLYEDIANC